MADSLIVTAPSTEELREEVERLRLMHAISLEFSASLDFDELLPRVFQRVLTALGAEGGSLWMTEGDVLRCRVAQGGAGVAVPGLGHDRLEGHVVLAEVGGGGVAEWVEFGR